MISLLSEGNGPVLPRDSRLLALRAVAPASPSPMIYKQVWGGAVYVAAKGQEGRCACVCTSSKMLSSIFNMCGRTLPQPDPIRSTQDQLMLDTGTIYGTQSCSTQRAWMNLLRCVCVCLYAKNNLSFERFNFTLHRVAKMLPLDCFYFYGLFWVYSYLLIKINS